MRVCSRGNFCCRGKRTDCATHPPLMLRSSSSSAPSSPDPGTHIVWIRSMSTRRTYGGTLSKDFHDLMLSQNIAQSHHTLHDDGDPQPSQAPSISRAPPKNTPSQPTHIRQPYGQSNWGSQPQSSPSRPSFNHSSKGVTVEFKQVCWWTLSRRIKVTLGQQYSTMQKGYLALEARCERRDRQIQRLKDDINILNEQHEKDTQDLAGQLDNRVKELEKLRGELDNVSGMSRAVRATVEKASNYWRSYATLVPAQLTSRLSGCG